MSSVFLPRIYKIALEKKFLPEKVRVQGNPSHDKSERRVMTSKDRTRANSVSLQKNWGPYVLLKMSKTGLVFSQGGIAVDNMKNKNN